MSGLAAEPAVQSAVLRLWVRSVAAPGAIEVAPVLSPWQEETITAGSAAETGTAVAAVTIEERHASQFVGMDVANGNDGFTTPRAQFSRGPALFSGVTELASAHTHPVTSTSSTHVHSIDVPNLPASGPGTSHAHAATADTAAAHAHGITVDSAGVPTVDVTMPYLQLLVCRKN